MKSYYKDDINLSDLNRHLLLLPDIINKQLRRVKKVTPINTICEAMNTSNAFKEMLPTVRRLLRLYLTLPITSATSVTFSALRRLMTYTRSKMTEKTFNNCFLLHAHKDLTDDLDFASIENLFMQQMNGLNTLVNFS